VKFFLIVEIIILSVPAKKLDVSSSIELVMPHYDSSDISMFPPAK
jgi:hypothetical protein